MGLLGQRTNAFLSLLIISRSPSTKVTPLCTPSENVGEMTCFLPALPECEVTLLDFACLMNEKEFFSEV